MSANTFTRNIRMVDMDTHKTVGVTSAATLAIDLAFVVGLVTREDMDEYPEVWDTCKEMQRAYETREDRTAYESYFGIQLVSC